MGGQGRWPDHGETITPAPIIANGKVIIGFGGDEFAARGRLDAYNLADGKKVWEFYATGTDKDVGLTSGTNKAHPEYGNAGKDLGISTYPAMNGSAAVVHSGASTAMTRS